MSGDVCIVRAETARDLDLARALFEAYAASLEFDLGFQGFREELAGFPGEYASPHGCILLAHCDGEVGGCIALRCLDEETCEMKRLYVVQEFRGRGAGLMLAEALIEEARRLGYRRMRLDTVPSMEAARGLYRRLGFREIEPYCHNPIPGASFMEIELGPGRGES